MKKMLIILILLGITIYYDVDRQTGGIFINSAVEDCTILAYPNSNRVVWYDSGGIILTMTYDKFQKDHGSQLLKNVIGSMVIIQRIDLKESPKIVY